jgi:type I restriction enzyme R subunit
MPQIAVSVDMLDTGIDVPEVVNLVFFKKIRSKIKFWQMVGRGTRLCPNVSGDGEDKKDFYLFDWLGNIEYFAYMAEKEPEPRQSLSSRLFTVKTELVATLQEPVHQDKPGVKEITQNIKDSLAEQVQALGDEQIGVRKNWELVDRFRKQETWNYLSAIDSADLTRFVAPMVNTEVRDIAALKFDLLMYLQMIALVQEGARPATKAQRKVSAIAQALLQKTNIPAVAAKRDLLVEIANVDNLRHADLAHLQHIQQEIRDIVHYLAGEHQQIFVLNITDILNPSQEEDGPEPVVSYYQRIMDWLQENRNLPVLQKLRNIEPLTHADIIQLETICWRDLGTHEEYQEYVRSCRMICGDQVAIFIRSLFGIDRIKAYQRYSDFLTTTALNPAQEQYLNAIVEYVSRNGDITTNTLVNEPSFLPFQWQRVFGPEMVNLGRYVNNFHDVIVA